MDVYILLLLCLVYVIPLGLFDFTLLVLQKIKRRSVSICPLSIWFYIIPSSIWFVTLEVDISGPKGIGNGVYELLSLSISIILLRLIYCMPILNKQPKKTTALILLIGSIAAILIVLFFPSLPE